MITADDFDAWRDNPITQAVFKAHLKLAEANKATWLALSWGNGEVDPIRLADLKARAEMCQDMTEITLDELETMLADE